VVGGRSGGDLPALADAMSGAPQSAGYLAGAGFFWTIGLLDLGVFLPLTGAACIGVRRGLCWAPKALYTVVGWFGLVGPAVAAMGIAMELNDDPAASTGQRGVHGSARSCVRRLRRVGVQAALAFIRHR
jgi:hypothetical protein